MNHVYQYNGYYISAKNKKEALEYYLEENDENVLIKYFKKQDDESILDIMLTENCYKDMESGDLNIPENNTKNYLGEDGYDDYTWMVSAKCGDWAKINDGFLCKEIE